MRKNLGFEATIKRVGITTIIWNLLLSIIKLVAGVLAKSSAMISDAIHSASDIFTTVIVMIGAKMSRKRKDKNHLYGHERFESIASIFLGVLLGITALGIGYGAVQTLIHFKPNTFEPSDFVYLALIGAILSILIKGWMYFYTIKQAKRINSTSLQADAWHHLTDSLSSFGSLLGIGGLMIGGGLEILDPIASIVICLIILKIAFEIIKSAVDQLVDKSISEELANDMKEFVLSNGKIDSINSFRSRLFGNRIYLDIIINLDSRYSFVEADLITKEVHDCLEKQYKEIKHCVICARPIELEQKNI